MMDRETKQVIVLGALSALAIYLWSRSGQAVIEEGLDMIGRATRGERNNNPGNIDKGQPWQGLATAQPDSRFASFVSPEYGIRALGKLLLTYYRTYGLDTINGIISRWAPSVENNTNAYAAAVARETGFDANQEIDLTDHDALFAVAKAIIRHENGRVSYSDATIASGIQMALA